MTCKDAQKGRFFFFFLSGTLPDDASFGMQAVLTNHFAYGGYYPVGGASEIAYNIIPTVEAAGGRVLVRSKVTKILVDSGRAVGITVKQGKSHFTHPASHTRTLTGHTLYDVMAPLVISDAGLYNTVESLLPPAVVKEYSLSSLLTHVRHGVGLMSVFVGLDGTPEELGLKAGHTWAFRGSSLQQITADYLSTPREDISSAKVQYVCVCVNRELCDLASCLSTGSPHVSFLPLD